MKQNMDKELRNLCLAYDEVVAELKVLDNRVEVKKQQARDIVREIEKRGLKMYGI